MCTWQTQCVFSELYILLGIRGMDGLLHQPPAIHSTEWVHANQHTLHTGGKMCFQIKMIIIWFPSNFIFGSKRMFLICSLVSHQKILKGPVLMLWYCASVSVYGEQQVKAALIIFLVSDRISERTWINQII